MNRQEKRAKKKRRVLLQLAMPPDVREVTSPKLTLIVEEYLKELFTQPMMSYGTDTCATRHEFAKRQAVELVGSGPAALEDDTVRRILAIAFADDEFKVTFANDFYVVLEFVAATGLAAGIYKLLQAVEISLTLLSDDALATLSVNEGGAETFRGLAGEFTGTFDELVEVARGV